MENGERKFKRHYVIGLTLLTLISGWGGAALMLGAYPEHYVEWLPYMPLFFYFWGLISWRFSAATPGGK